MENKSDNGQHIWGNKLVSRIQFGPVSGEGTTSLTAKKTQVSMTNKCQAEWIFVTATEGIMALLLASVLKMNFENRYQDIFFFNSGLRGQMDRHP